MSTRASHTERIAVRLPTAIPNTPFLAPGRCHRPKYKLKESTVKRSQAIVTSVATRLASSSPRQIKGVVLLLTVPEERYALLLSVPSVPAPTETATYGSPTPQGSKRSRPSLNCRSAASDFARAGAKTAHGVFVFAAAVTNRRSSSAATVLPKEGSTMTTPLTVRELTQPIKRRVRAASAHNPPLIQRLPKRRSRPKAVAISPFPNPISRNHWPAAAAEARQARPIATMTRARWSLR